MMNRDFLVQFVRLLVLIITIVYLNVCSCGQNAFGAHANRNSTSDSEFVHIGQLKIESNRNESLSFSRLGRFRDRFVRFS